MGGFSWNMIADWLLVIGGAAALLFVFIYSITLGRYARAQRRLTGKSNIDLIQAMLLTTKATTVIFAVVVCLSLFLGVDYPGREIVRIVGYGALAAGEWFFVLAYLSTRSSVVPVHPTKD